MAALANPLATSANEFDSLKTQSKFPVLKAGSTRCPAVIMHAAKIAVSSNESELANAIGRLKTKNCGLVLAAENDGPYAQDYFYADPKFIKTQEENSVFIAIYSQIKATNGKKFVVTQKTAYWHQSFDLYLLDASVDPKFLDYEKPYDDETLPKGCTHLANTTFDKPWLFWDSKNKQMYAVIRNDDPSGVNIWDVYSTSASTSKKPVATLEFQPSVKNAISLIPKGPLLTVQQTLDTMIGPPEKTGHFMGTDALRFRVSVEWSNLFLRPWAVSKPINARAKVDRRMLSWSKMNSKARGIYTQFQSSYPAAEKQLTTYYEQHFQVSHPVALKLAAQGLDSIKRNSFSFGSN
jgi:hypothetical protein